MTQPTIQFVVIGPVTDPTSLAIALAAMPTSEPPPSAEPDDRTTIRIDTTTVKISTRPDGSRHVQIVGAAGRQQLVLTAQAA